MKLADIASEVAGCRACPMYRRCVGPVPGAGLSTAKLMVVDQAPGPPEDKVSRPATGPAGRFLTTVLELQGWHSARVYYTYLVKCSNGRNDPTKEALLACGTHLKRELDAVRPDLVLSLGALVTRWFGIRGGINQISGQVFDTNYGAVMPLLTPGSLLTPAHKKDTPMFVTLLKSIDTYLEGVQVPPAHSKPTAWLEERGYA